MGHHSSERKVAHHVDMLDGSRKGSHDRRESMRPASVSSSDLSDVSSLNRRRKSSAPKVAAVVIASLAIVAVLVGVTVYLIDMEREKQEIERAERIEEGIETEVEFAEAANAFIADEMDEVEDEVLQRMEAEKTRRERIKTLSQRRRFLENFQHRQEDFLRPSAEEESYISSLVASRRAQVEQGERMLRKEGGLVTPSSRGDTTGASTQDLEFGGVGLFGPQSDGSYEVTEGQEIDNHQRHEEANPASTPMTMQSMRGGNIYDMAAYVKPTQEESRPANPSHPRRTFRGRPRVRPGMEGLRRMDPTMEQAVRRMEGRQQGEEERPMIPLLRSDPGLATIDRRPGRPMFHHQGPLGPLDGPVASPAIPGNIQGLGGSGPKAGPRQPGFRRRLRNPQAMRLRQMETRNKQAADAVLKNRLSAGIDMEEQQHQILDNFDTFLKIAGSELGALRSVARNITESGSDVNLWEILAAVNSTVRKNPDSSIAQLMGKFEEKYLADDGSMSAVHPAEAVYERSLSSLLFLSMGIFLLNSVNELVQTGNLPAGEARSMPTDTALMNLVKDSSRHEEVFQLFNSTAFDIFDHEDGQNLLDKIKPTNPASTVNSYVRLVMNLVNAYIRDGAEFECIYAAYCYEVNQQAKLGGMASSVAKINSVGLRLALKELRTEATVPALAKSLLSWTDLPCQELFPTCDLTAGTKVELS